MLMLKEKSSNPVELQNLNKIQISLKELRNINFSKNVCWVDFIDFFQMYIIMQVFHGRISNHHFVSCICLNILFHPITI